MRIHATRSSVCLGDDFAGPEEKDQVLDEQARLSYLMKQLAGYVPYFGNLGTAVDFSTFVPRIYASYFSKLDTAVDFLRFVPRISLSYMENN